MTKKIFALVGMCGAGKTAVADEFKKQDWAHVRLGQITLDEVKRRGLEPNEQSERPIREEFRAKYGMAAFATLNFPKIDRALEGANVIVDGLYSWSEYKEFKNKYGDAFGVIAVYASPETRYARLENRAAKHGDDPSMVFRSFTRDDAKSRDCAEIENSEKGGPIAMADWTVVNEGTPDELIAAARAIISKINES